MKGTIEPVLVPGVTATQFAQLGFVFLALGVFSWTKYVARVTRI